MYALEISFDGSALDRLFSVKFLEIISPRVFVSIILIADAYVPIHVEVASRQSHDKMQSSESIH